MLKAVGLCILIFTIYKGVKGILREEKEKSDISVELLNLFRHTLLRVKSYMKSANVEIASFSSPVLNKYRVQEYILNRDVSSLESCSALSSDTRRLLVEYIKEPFSIELSYEVERLELLVKRLADECERVRGGFSEKRKLYTILGASVSFAVIILII